MKRSALIIATTGLLAAGCGGAQTPSAQISPVSTGPSAKVVQRWPTEWCSATAGWPKRTLYRLMGRPTEQWSDSARWDAYGYQFNAFFDENGNIRQLDVNDIALSPTQRAKIHCATTRVDAGS